MFRKISSARDSDVQRKFERNLKLVKNNIVLETSKYN